LLLSSVFGVEDGVGPDRYQIDHRSKIPIGRVYQLSGIYSVLRVEWTTTVYIPAKRPAQVEWRRLPGPGRVLPRLLTFYFLSLRRHSSDTADRPSGRPVTLPLFSRSVSIARAQTPWHDSYSPAIKLRPQPTLTKRLPPFAAPSSSRAR
jgi:hypothetical protein